MLARIKCWWNGHYSKEVQYEVEGAEKYLGRKEFRTFRQCAVCGKGTKEKELKYSESRSFLERHDWVMPLTVVIGLFIAIMAIIILPNLYFANKGCLDAGLQMGIESKYSIWSGCFFKIDGRWIADDLLKVVDLLK